MQARLGRVGMDWDHIYRTTRLEDLHWYPGEPDQILQSAVQEGWLPGHTLLDIGAGQGTDAIYLASKGYAVTGLDISEVACQLARQEAGRNGAVATFVHGDALNAPFSDASFDVVMDRGCFHHFAPADRSIFAGQVARVLKPNGVYFYRNFSFRSQMNQDRQNLLTEQAVREVFAPKFQIDRFGEYSALGMGGRSPADMHWALMRRKQESSLL